MSIGSVLVVRGERAADRGAISAVHRAAFGREDEADLVDRLRTERRPGSSCTLAFNQDGSGRSSVFSFSIVRNGLSVPFECLSDGETVLTAAAFLSALQSIKTGPGTLLTLNTEGVGRRAV
ncbi:MAG: hypothetical protein KJZ65_02180 [Phycisphaerales bacterium]|nr:hypothetical protein [Phycisphaerales bacterium]